MGPTKRSEALTARMCECDLMGKQSLLKVIRLEEIIKLAPKSI